MDEDKEYNGLQCNAQLQTRMDDETRRMTDDEEDDGHENNGFCQQSSHCQNHANQGCINDWLSIP